MLYFQFRLFKLPKLLWISVRLNNYVIKYSQTQSPSTAMNRNTFAQRTRASLNNNFYTKLEILLFWHHKFVSCYEHP